MAEVLLNNELSLLYPEGFEQMDTLELARDSFTDRTPYFSIRDSARHISVTASWKKVGKLSVATTGVMSAAKKSERNFCAAMQTRDYRSGGLNPLQLGGKDAAAYRCAYRLDGLEMTGISLVGKGKDSFYYIHGYFQTESLEESLPVWEELVKSICWKE